MSLDNQNHLSVGQQLAIDAFKKGMTRSQVFKMDSQNHSSVEQRFAIDAFRKGMTMSQVFKIIEQYKDLNKVYNMTNAVRIEDNEFHKFIINDVFLNRSEEECYYYLFPIEF